MDQDDIDRHLDIDPNTPNAGLELLGRMQKQILSIASKLTNGDHHLTDECFAHAVDHANRIVQKWDAQYGIYLSVFFLYRIRLAMMTYLKDKKRKERKKCCLTEEVMLHCESYDDSIERIDMEDLLEQLNKYEYSLCQMHFFEGMPKTEIAQFFQKNVQTIKIQLARALDYLRVKADPEEVINTDSWVYRSLTQTGKDILNAINRKKINFTWWLGGLVAGSMATTILEIGGYTSII